MNAKNFMALMVVGLFAVACSNDDDKKKEEKDPEVKEVVNGDYTSYADWTYINLETGTTEKHPDATEWIYTNGNTTAAQTPEEIGIDWHIAIHRYEIKTNNGQACNTGATSLSEVKSLPTGVTWTSDETVSYESQQAEGVAEPLEVITDMAGMMTGNGVGYSKAPVVNDVLCDGTSRTPQSGMPPTLYEPRKKVLVVKFGDGSWAKLLFTDAGNTENNKSGYITWQYAFYPAE